MDNQTGARDASRTSPNPWSVGHRSTHSSVCGTPSRRSSSRRQSRTLSVSEEPNEQSSSEISPPSYGSLPSSASSSSDRHFKKVKRPTSSSGELAKVVNLDWIDAMIQRHVLINSLREPVFKATQSDVDDLDLATKLLTAPLVPPLGFAMVTPGVYRALHLSPNSSGHPNYRNFAFLEGLKLTSIMYLCTDTYRPHTFNWAQDRGLKIFHYRIELSKDPATPLPPHSLYANALGDLLDRRNLPILIHCNKGQHRVGSLCALLRLFQGWDKTAVKAEWDKFLGEPPPPGLTVMESPGPAPALVYAGSDSSGTSVAGSDTSHSKAHKLGKVKIKFDSRTRINEWNYVEEFPMDIVPVDPQWMPAWLPIEMGTQPQL